MYGINREKNYRVNEIFAHRCTYRLELMRDLLFHFDVIKQNVYEAIDDGGGLIEGWLEQGANPDDLG